MAEPIAALIVRILADTADMVVGVKQVTGQLDTLESRVGKFGQALAGYFSAQAIIGFANEILHETQQIEAGAKRVGAGVEEFQKFSFALKQNGIDASAAEQAISTLNARVGEGDAGLLGVLRKLNINFDEFKAKDPIQRYIDLGVAIAGIADPAERTAMRVEALGAKGEKAAAQIDAAFAEVAKNAPVYSKEAVAALEKVGNKLDELYTRAKQTAAQIALALATNPPLKPGALGMGEFGDTGPVPGGASDPGVDLSKVTPGSPKGLQPDGLSPAVSAQYAMDLADQLARNNREREHAIEVIRENNEEWKREIDIFRLLKVETPPVTDAIGKLMDKMDTTNKVDRFIQRITDAALRIAVLDREAEQLLERLNPGSTNLAGDDTDAAIFKLRSDPNSWTRDRQFLTDQATAEEARLIDNANLRQLVSQMRPTGGTPSAPWGSNVPGFASVLNPTSLTINAQGSYLGDPESMNRFGRLIEDILASRSSGTQQYSRR